MSFCPIISCTACTKYYLSFLFYFIFIFFVFSCDCVAKHIHCDKPTKTNPKIYSPKLSGLNILPISLALITSEVPGSKSTQTARGTYLSFPAPPTSGSLGASSGSQVPGNAEARFDGPHLTNWIVSAEISKSSISPSRDQGSSRSRSCD